MRTETQQTKSFIKTELNCIEIYVDDIKDPIKTSINPLIIVLLLYIKRISTIKYL